MRILMGFLILIMTVDVARASDAVLEQNVPNYFQTQASSMMHQDLGTPCTAMTSVQFVLPCNPAFASQKRFKMFSAQVFMGSEYSQIERARQILDKNITPSTAEALFSDPSGLQMEANAELNFRTQYFGTSIVPERLTYYSLVQDKAYPIIDLQAMEEKSFSAQVGGEVEDNIFAGIQVRMVDRKFVQDNFSLYDFLAENHDPILQIKKQDAVYLEPGFAYFLPNDPWKTRTSVMLSNVGFANQQYEEIPMNPIVDWGFGVEPPLDWGDWELAINYRFSEQMVDDPSEHVRIATAYTIGLLQAALGVDRNNASAGVTTSVGPVRAGISYAMNRFDDLDGNSIYAHTIFTEFGIIY